MSFEVEGKLHHVYGTEQKSDTFRTREFVIEIPGQYPNYVKFQLTQDKCDIVDSYKTGQQVKVYFDLRGRQWQDKYFTNLQAWRMEAVGESSAPAPTQREVVHSANGGASKSGGVENSDPGSGDFDDLPF